MSFEEALKRVFMKSDDVKPSLLRDTFATAALNGLLAYSSFEPDDAALLAYRIADSMIAARKLKAVDK